MAKNIDSDAEITSIRMIEQTNAPAPDAGYSHVFAKADGLYIVDDDDVVTGPLVMAQDIGCRVYNDADIGIDNISNTVITFNSERWDTDTIHSTISNTSRLTATTAGKYIIIGQIYWDSDAVGLRQLQIILNGTTVIANRRDPGQIATNTTIHEISTIYELSATDYVELEVYQDSGATLDIISSTAIGPEFMMQRIG